MLMIIQMIHTKNNFEANNLALSTRDKPHYNNKHMMIQTNCFQETLETNCFASLSSNMNQINNNNEDTITKTFLDKTYNINVNEFHKAKVINLSSQTLDKHCLETLSKGLNFAPTPKPPDMNLIRTSLNELFRRLRLKVHFNDMEPIQNTNWEIQQTIDRKFRNKSTWTPAPNADIVLDTFIEVIKRETQNLKPIKIRNRNLPDDLYTDINILRQIHDIVIKRPTKAPR